MPELICCRTSCLSRVVANADDAIVQFSVGQRFTRFTRFARSPALATRAATARVLPLRAE